MDDQTSKNCFYSFAHQALVTFLPLVTVPYVSRILGANGIGIYSYTNSIIFYFVIFGGLGIPGYGIREISIHRDNAQDVSEIFWELALLQLSLVVLSTCAYLAIAYIYSNSYRIYYWSWIPLLLSAAFDVSWFYRGIERLDRLLLWKLLVKIINIALVFFLVKEPGDTAAYILIQAGSELIGNLFLYFQLRRFLIKVNICHLNFRRHLKAILIYFIPTVATTIYSMADKTMLGLICGSEAENGYYEQAHKMVSMLTALIVSLNTAMLPSMTNLFARKRLATLQKHLDNSLHYILMLAIPACFGLISIAPPLILCLLGPDFEHAIPLLRLFSMAIPIIAVSNCLEKQFTTPSGNQLRVGVILSLGAMVNILLNLLFIPTGASMGAVTASLLSELLITVLLILYGGSRISLSRLAQVAFPYLCASEAMVAMVLLAGKLAKNPFLSLVVGILLGVLVYLSTLYFLKEKYFILLLRKMYRQSSQFLNK